MQQVSGGFGDSTNLDEETMQILLAQQQRVAEMQKGLVFIGEDQWETMSVNEEYSMESQLFDYSALTKQPNFGIKRYNDSIYRGELVNNKRQGLGVMVYRKARIYEGEWDRDARNGQGMERYSNGNRYEG